MESITGLIHRFPGKTGQTFSNRDRATSPFSSFERMRMVDPMTRARFPMSFPISMLGLPTTLGGDDADPALLREDVEIAIEIRAADHVQHDVNSPVVRKPLDLRDEIRLPVVDGALWPQTRRRRFLCRRFRRWRRE